MTDSIVDASLMGHTAVSHKASQAFAGLAPEGFLRAMVAVARSPRRNEYVVVHFASGSVFRTDRLGAQVVRALIDGRSAAEAVELAERIETGAGERAWRLIGGLDTKGAIARMPPAQAVRRSRLRRPAAVMLGVALNVIGRLVRVTPTRVLAWTFGVLPSSLIVHHVWRSVRHTIVDNLRSSGYSGRPQPSLSYAYLYLSMVLSPERLGSFVNHLFDRASADELAARLQVDGPTVGVSLHGTLSIAVPTALRTRGQEVVRSVVPWSHGINVSERSGPLRDFFGDSPEMAVEVTDPLASVTLLRHLKAGRSVYVGLVERPTHERKPSAEIEMLGHAFPRNDGPAWLAVRSGRPIALWTTSSSPSGVVIKESPPLYADPSLPVERRVAILSERLYAYAEAAIREHPEQWTGWSHLSHVKGERSQS